MEKLVIKNRDGIWFIDYEFIIYFEFVGKKIYLHTDKEEMIFEDTLWRLESILPSYFMRCHRGFIVNSNKILNVNFAKGFLLVISGERIPVSRSYKEIVKEKLKSKYAL